MGSEYRRLEEARTNAAPWRKQRFDEAQEEHS